MLRRNPALVAALAFVLAMAAHRPSAHAAPIYSLTNNGTEAVDNVFALVEPPGQVSKPDSNATTDAEGRAVIGPITVLDKAGFDASKLTVSLLDGNLDGPKQVLALNFGNGGLQSGGRLDFALAIDPAYTGTLNLQLVDLQTLAPLASGGLSLVPVPPDTEEPPTETPPPVDVPEPPVVENPAPQVPEPVTLLLWAGGMATLGLVRARAHRRRAHPMPA